MKNYNPDTTDSSVVLFTEVDENDNILGSVSRETCHNETTKPWHRTIHCYIFFTDWKLILSQRSMSKDTAPGEWTVSVGGHVRYGSSYEDQAKKCSFKNNLFSPLIQIDKLKVDYGSEREMIAIFAGIANSFPPIDPNQVLQFKTFDLDTLVKDFTEGKFDLSGGSRDTFKHVIETGTLLEFYKQHVKNYSI